VGVSVESLIEQALARTGTAFLFITSANLSHTATGTQEEAAHYRLAGIQADFGHLPGVVLVAHPDEAAARRAYLQHVPQSTSILVFHRLLTDEAGRPALCLERHSSLPAAAVAALLARHGLGLVLGRGATHRLPQRQY
jgi:hypothetical protein